VVRGAGDGEAVAAAAADVEAEAGAFEGRVPDAGSEAQVGVDVRAAVGAERAAAAVVAVRMACVYECVGARPDRGRLDAKAVAGVGGCDGGGGEQERDGERPDAREERHSCLRSSRSSALDDRGAARADDRELEDACTCSASSATGRHRVRIARTGGRAGGDVGVLLRVGGRLHARQL
jgi:hypothetical protein